MEKSIGEIVADELKYAERMHKIEEELGCPIEVRIKVVIGSVIYDDEGFEYTVIDIGEKEILCQDGQCDDRGIDYEYTFRWNEYKTDWFLKEDKSE